jgi:hypothetical protein
MINASAVVVAAGTSSACGGTISVPGSWERASGEITCVLNARHFRGVKLSTRCRHGYEKLKKAASANESEETE